MVRRSSLDCNGSWYGSAIAQPAADVRNTDVGSAHQWREAEGAESELLRARQRGKTF